MQKIQGKMKKPEGGDTDMGMGDEPGEQFASGHGHDPNTFSDPEPKVEKKETKTQPQSTSSTNSEVLKLKEEATKLFKVKN